GMVAYWRKAKSPGSRRSLVVNFVGAVATGVTSVVVVVSKLAEGAWVALFALSAIVLMFSRIHRHYASVAAQVADDEPIDLTKARAPLVVVPTQKWNKLASRGLRFAVELSPDVHALHILTQDSTISELTALWEELVAGPARAAGLAVPKLV